MGALIFNRERTHIPVLKYKNPGQTKPQRKSLHF